MQPWFYLVVALSAASIIWAKNNRVSVVLRTNWLQTSLFSEASEYAAEEDLGSFWRLIDHVQPIVKEKNWPENLHASSSNELGLDAESYLQLEDAVIRSVVPPANVSDQTTVAFHRQLIRLFLSSRSYSPAVEMAHQVALTTASQLFNCSHNDAAQRLSECMTGTTWAQVGDRIVCQLAELPMAIRARISRPMDFGFLPREKFYPVDAEESNLKSPCVILYGSLDQPDFYDWHAQAKASTEQNNCVYVFRHYMKIRPEGKVRLGGYGVELALKSTEYKAMDDTKVDNAGDTSGNLADSPVDPVVQGFNFTTLNELHPDLKEQLKAFQKHLFATDDEIRPLKVWQFRELGIQTAQAIMNGFRLGNSSSEINTGLETLRDVSQYLPARAGRLVSLKVDPALREELSTNQYVLSNLGIQPGQTMLFINGLLISPSVDIFALLDLLRHESHLMLKLHKLCIPANRIPQLLEASSSGGQLSDGNSNDPAVPGSKYSLSGKFALDLANAPVIYFNNLEVDLAYSNWPNSLHTLFTPDFSGGIRRLRRNLYNVILLVDPASEDSRQMIRLVESFLVHQTSIRFGLLWAVDSTATNSASVALVRAFTFITSTVSSTRDSPLPLSVPNLGSPGAMSALSFLTELYSQAEKTNTELTVSLIRRTFERLFPSAHSEDVFDDEFGQGDYDSQLKKHQIFTELSGLKGIGRIPLMLFNGLVFDTTGMRQMGGFEDSVVTLCMEEMIRVQHAVYHGQMSNSDNVFVLYRKSNSQVTRFNARILSTRPQDIKYLDVVGSGSSPSARGPYDVQSFLNNMRYFQKGDTEVAIRPVTMWVVVSDLDAVFLTPKERQIHEKQLGRDLNMVRSALTHLRSAHASKGLRLGIVYNPSTVKKTAIPQTAWLTRALYLVGHPVRSPGSTEKLVKHADQMAARNFGIRLLTGALDAINASEKYATMESMLVSGIDHIVINKAIEAVDRDQFIETHAAFCHNSLGLKPGQRAIVINGKIIGPLDNNELIMEDFRLAERITLDTGARELSETINTLMGSELGGPEVVSELTWRISSILQPRLESADPIIGDADAVEGIGSKSRIQIKGLTLEHAGFELPVVTPEPAFDILAVVNPASRDAQRLSHVLVVLRQSIPNSMRVVLNPIINLPELPVKNFYQFVWEPSPFQFSRSQGSRELISSNPVIPRVEFSHLPGQPILTLGMDAPHGWMVAAAEAVHDLDNLRLADVYGSVEAVYELEHLLLEGHCFSEGSMKPPRGLQLTLGPASDLNRHDTIVMANLGYFQLKAGPGAWHLRIRDGRSRDLYTMAQGENIRQVDVNTTELITTIDSFRSKIVIMRVSQRPERAGESLIDESGLKSTTTTARSPWNWLSRQTQVLSKLSNYAENLCPSWLSELARSLQSKLPWQTCHRMEETINVFSLASGHLYERLLRIMMLTVIRHTESPVKFWFLKNYLSPTFKQFIPHMAKQYGFEYELVEYQWPRWLHSQTEKQRIIWGYKILFLDVLFPLNVTKIIYVDADQIVRADLQELADLDLEGAPYGYTPFCDSRREMDGFRFWKQGYWANHLNGRPYHISALYVVDLHRFRQLAAGDRLRGQYHGLSQDPNSLSNLDQDLPNNMIHQVPIKSLPQEWLWCETWCSEESKQYAKTIDLCNNPQTKEPKLSAAMRIAPEWVDYDREIKKLWQRVNPSTKPKASISEPSSSSSPPPPTTTTPGTPVSTGSSPEKARPFPPPGSETRDSEQCSSSTCSADTKPAAFKPPISARTPVSEPRTPEAKSEHEDKRSIHKIEL
ncbi:UDP-glucose:glycoprotein glucosyltransferase [Fasciola hepatica]|uniref:UDP-glucose:glycoprotein glucosyltransferase n=1 Tax=Fasciola hepatica TaxID=6192 RepID=A0A4E0RY02_FASHE|nr:UDP-glucose:glycoprotein glucosyltransferase [Fasciola hepatica]